MADSAIVPLGAKDPRELGGYRMVGRIGRGGMGTVYLADTADGTRVAVKVINPDLAEDPSFHARFRHEVDAARIPNITSTRSSRRRRGRR